MNDTARMILLIHASRREDDWRRADDWRRMHARSDASPIQAAEPTRRAGFAQLLRLIVRHE
ncbi:MAG: hypothetical protein HW391_1363 [Chloroflexi bacterium]|nr:hypothetical protein [Chloroflexota bacterium]